MITVYGRATSSNVQLVMWTIGELGLDHERLDYGHAHGGTDTAAYRAMNPNGRVPTFRETGHPDGDLVMFESGAIARYLAGRYGDTSFWPADPVVRARLDVWCEWVKVTLAPAFAQPIFWTLLSHPPNHDGSAVAKAAENLKPLIQMIEDRIGDGPWMAGEVFTFADIWAGHLLYRYNSLTFSKIDTPALDAYYARLKDRPAFAEHVMVPFEVLRMWKPG
ncbi:MAG: glutathione S-transferase family protein [Pseudomonadota bacterium]